MFHKILKAVSCSLIFLSLISCTRNPDIAGDPKQRLIEYISKSFMIKQPEDKSQLLSYLTGDVKARLESWSSEQFRDAFLSKKRELIKLSIREIKSISDDEAQITYELVYSEIKTASGTQTSQAKITNKKLCQMVRGDHGRWYIADVKNIKELIEFKDELSLP